MQFRILGSVEVADDSGELRIGAARERALLLRLLLDANRVVPAERLIDDLWGPAPPQTAPTSLRVHVSRLRKALSAHDGDSRVVSRQGGYGLAPAEGDEIDAVRFDALLVQGRGQLDRGETERAGLTLRVALELWRGPAMGELAELDFARPEAVRLEEARLSALEARIDADLARGGHSQLTGELEALCAAHPLREHFWAQRMLALYRSGRQAEALRAYQDLRRYLGEELGLEPSAELGRLEAAIVAQSPELAPSSGRAASLPAPGISLAPALRRADGPLVGRVTELTLLERLWQETAEGKRQMVLIGGEPGAGKTRLAAEIARRAHGSGAVVLHGQYDEEMLLPYQGIVQALRHLTRSELARRRELGLSAPELARLIPELRSDPSALAPVGANPETERYQLFAAIESVLLAASASERLLIVLDDLHWADSSTLILLKQLARTEDEAPFMIVGTYRDTEVHPGHRLAGMIADLRSSSMFHQLQLGGLDQEAVTQLVAARVGSRSGDSAALAREIHARTGGNPFFADALAARIAESDDVELGDLALAELDVPEAVGEIIANRVARASGAATSVLTTAAVLGSEFDFSMLREAGGLGEETAISGIEEAAHLRLITGVPGRSMRYCFRHSLVRDAIYAGVESVRRAAYHRRAAEALERLHGDAPDRAAELAHHYLASGLENGSLDKIIFYSRRAGDFAMSQFAFEMAARQYETALDAMSRLPAGDEMVRAEVLIAASRALQRAGETERAQTLAEEATGIAAAGRAHTMLARAALAFEEAVWTGNGFMASPAAERTATLLHEAIDGLSDDEPVVRAELLARMPRVLYWQGQPDDTVRYAEQALDVAQRTQLPRLRASALEGLRWALWGSGQLERQVAVSDQILQEAEAGDDPFLAMRGHIWRYLSLLEVADMAGVDHEIEAMGQLGERLHDPLGQWFAVAAAATRALLAGRLAEAEERAVAAFAMARKFGMQWAVLGFGIQLYYVRREQGRVAELADATKAVATQPGAMAAQRCALADLYCLTDRREEAAAAFDALAGQGFATIPRDLGWVVSLTMLSDACAYLDDRRRANVLYELLLPYAGRNVVIGPGNVCTGSASRNLGQLAITLERWDEAGQHLDAALRFNDAIGAEPWVGRTHLARARLLLGRGRRGDAAKAGQEVELALAIAARLGLGQVAAEARVLQH